MPGSSSEFPHAATAEALAAAHASAAAGDAASADRSHAKRWRWVLGGGQAPNTAEAAPAGEAAEQPQQPRPVYATGHQDGRVRLWDMRAEVPALLATVPFDAGGAGGKLRPVCGLQARALYNLSGILQTLLLQEDSSVPCR